MNTIRKAVWRGYELLITFANLLRSPLLLALRLYFFWQLYQTGKGKLSDIGRIIHYFAGLGIPAHRVNAYFVSALECYGSLLLIVGLGSRPIALMIVISMCVAYSTGDPEAVKSIFSDNPDKFVQAAPFPYLLAALIVLAFGPGLFSVDALLKRVIGGKTLVRPDPRAGRSSESIAGR